MSWDWFQIGIDCGLDCRSQIPDSRSQISNSNLKSPIPVVHLVRLICHHHRPSPIAHPQSPTPAAIPPRRLLGAGDPWKGLTEQTKAKIIQERAGANLRRWLIFIGGCVRFRKRWALLSGASMALAKPPAQFGNFTCFIPAATRWRRTATLPPVGTEKLPTVPLQEPARRERLSGRGTARFSGQRPSPRIAQ